MIVILLSSLRLTLKSIFQSMYFVFKVHVLFPSVLEGHPLTFLAPILPKGSIS